MTLLVTLCHFRAYQVEGVGVPIHEFPWRVKIAITRMTSLIPNVTLRTCTNLFAINVRIGVMLLLPHCNRP